MVFDMPFLEKTMPIENDRLQTLIYQAEKGNPISQVKLAAHYWVVEKDGASAIKYATMAANNNDPDGMWILATVYQFSEDVNDSQKAKEWYLKAAEKGNVSALYSVGTFFYDGLFDFEENKDLGIDYLRAAAFNDSFNAMKMLAEIYSERFFDIPKEDRKNSRFRESQDYLDLISFWAKRAMEATSDEEEKEEIKNIIKKLKEAIGK